MKSYNRSGCVWHCAIIAVFIFLMVQLVEFGIHIFAIPEEGNMMDEYYVKIVAEETDRWTGKELREYLMSQGFAESSHDASFAYGNLRQVRREDSTQVSYVGGGCYLITATTLVDLKYVDETGQEQSQTRYYTYESSARIAYKRDGIRVGHDYHLEQAVCTDWGLADSSSGKKEYYSWRRI